MVMGMASAPHAYAEQAGYQLYPTPHGMEYAEGTHVLPNEATTVIESGIDSDTVQRLNETMALKDIACTKASEVPAKGTAVLVGVQGSGGAVDAYVKQLVERKELTYPSALFEETDAYLLASMPAKDGAAHRIIVLGRDSDAAFYGLTSLYQIFQQLEGRELRAFTLSDYADVLTRGFIEGYYGNPWSTEDRVNLMTWGGHYKLNAYFYAPKDDPKHNKKWRELYTEEELKERIEPLAQAGNASKCRFVFALHPFMSDPITASNYDASVKVLKEKFTQVMDHGVRQIAVLADDAANQGNDLYIKLCKDMTDWLHEQQKATNANGTLKYPGLKDTLIFCPVNYMGQGEAWYAQLPSTVQVINTGGRVWGKIDNAFASAFQSNSKGVAPFMWINWPCSDNDKDALHMGGHNNFLGSDLKKGQVKGVVLNPMQQSEPSKQGIFMNADFSWNLWESEEHADQAWEDSFTYVDHNSPVETEGSAALRILSGHMKRMTGGGVTWENNESADIKDALASFRAKLTADTVTAADVDEMMKVITDLQTTAATFSEHAGTPAMLEQMKPWMDTWADLTRAALAQLAAVNAHLAGDASGLIASYAQATAALEEANGNSLWYIDHYEYARVGKAHITPLVNALNDYVAEKAALAADPDAVITKFVTNRTDTPQGSTDAIFDGDPSTGAEFRDPNKVVAGDYFGVTKSKPFDLDSVVFIQGGGKNFFDASKIQYLQDGAWKDVPGGKVYTSSKVQASGLALKGIEGVRLVAAQDNKLDSWPTINEIILNGAVEESGIVTGTVSVANQEVASTDHPLQYASDGKDTEAWFTHKASGANKDDATVKDAAVQVTFETPQTIDAIVFKQGASNSGDVIDHGTAYYQDAEGVWHEAGAVTSKTSQVIELAGPVEAKAVKVVNNERKAIWWRVTDLHASFGEVKANASITTNISQYQGNDIKKAADGNDETKFWSNRGTKQGDWAMLSFGEKKFIDTVRVLQGSSDCFASAKVYYTADAAPAQDGVWHELGEISGGSESMLDVERVEATGVKIVATAASDNWLQLFEFQAFEKYSYTKDNLFASFDLSGVDLVARVGGGSFATTNATVTLPHAGDVIAVDLGSVRRDIALANAADQVVARAELVYSQNGLEWHAAADDAASRARYVGYRATVDGASVAFASLTGSYLESLAPRVISSDLPGNQTLDASLIFDGNVATATKSSGGPTSGDTVVFDLGQERAISAFDYFVPETSLDFIRNAVVEVANQADAPDAAWTPVLDLNSKNIIPDDENSSSTAKESGLFEHSSQFPGNMVKSATGLDVRGRYLRIRFTGTYTARWVQIGELRINNGEYVSTYAGGDFESTAVEQAGKAPSNLLDKSLMTTWAPQGTQAGKLVYHVSAPLKADGTPYVGLRAIAQGDCSQVTVKAVVYTSDSFSSDATATVALGTLNEVLNDFGFGAKSHAVKDIVFEWPANVTPQISELYLLSALDGATSEEIANLKAALEAARATDTSSWTADSKAALEAAIAAVEQALGAPETLTSQQVAELASALDAAVKSPIFKYEGTELSELVAGAVTDGSSYTPESWKAYQDALAAARAGLEHGDNLSRAEGEELVSKLKAAHEGLTPIKAPDGGDGDGTGTPEGTTPKPSNPSNSKPGGTLVQTGDTALVMVACVLAAGVVLVGAGVAMRRRLHS